MKKTEEMRDSVKEIGREIVRIAKRDKNTKRNYLVINQLQGKHIPVRPSHCMQMFGALAKLVEGRYAGGELLVIGFAETATAIGAKVAVALDSFYIQTTREDMGGVAYIHFSESHSHATEQKIVKNEIDAVMPQIGHILFVEDEVTTGNTILHLVDVLKLAYPSYMGHIRFSVLSILNGMSHASLEKFKEYGIGVKYLVKTDHSNYGKIAEQYVGNGEDVDTAVLQTCCDSASVRADGMPDARRLVRGGEYLASCGHLWGQIQEKLPYRKGMRIVVIGTEEFMFPAIFIGQKLEECGCEVKTHSTTRSPIVASSGQGYPLYRRYLLKSFYEEGRKTYLYNLDSYDLALVVTDAVKDSGSGEESLLKAFYASGNRKAIFVRCYPGNEKNQIEKR